MGHCAYAVLARVNGSDVTDVLWHIKRSLETLVGTLEAKCSVDSAIISLPVFLLMGKPSFSFQCGWIDTRSP